MIGVVRRTRQVTEYQPVFEDWLFHGILPLAAYIAVFIAAIGLRRAGTLSLFAIGAAAVLLLFVGVHNAWDTVTYILVSRWEAHRGRPGGARDDAREERSLRRQAIRQSHRGGRPAVLGGAADAARAANAVAGARRRAAAAAAGHSTAPRPSSRSSATRRF